MAMLKQDYLFDWTALDTASDLERLKLVLQALPDEPLMEKLERARGRGRDDYPVRARWNAMIAGVVFQHPSVASRCRELRRNPLVRKLCGFDPLTGEAAVPTDSAFSRFFELLIGQEKPARRAVSRRKTCGATTRPTGASSPTAASAPTAAHGRRSASGLASSCTCSSTRNTRCPSTTR